MKGRMHDHIEQQSEVMFKDAAEEIAKNLSVLTHQFREMLDRQLREVYSQIEIDFWNTIGGRITSHESKGSDAEKCLCQTIKERVDLVEKSFLELAEDINTAKEEARKAADEQQSMDAMSAFGYESPIFPTDDDMDADSDSYTEMGGFDVDY